ncbi:MAG: NUDIX domain-containing protein [Eubacteriales bacterium]|nr:NUDIX domain-containing protein [Eubacteriales bacterium]
MQHEVPFVLWMSDVYRQRHPEVVARAQAALVRECREELGITLEVGEVFAEVLHEYPDITVRLTLFSARIREGTPQKLEHNDLRWITPEEIPQYPFCPADTEILEKLQGKR